VRRGSTAKVTGADGREGFVCRGVLRSQMSLVTCLYSWESLVLLQAKGRGKSDVKPWTWNRGRG